MKKIIISQSKKINALSRGALAASIIASTLLLMQSCSKNELQPAPSDPQSLIGKQEVSPIKDNVVTGTISPGTYEFISLITARKTPTIGKAISVVGYSATGALIKQHDWRVTSLGGGNFAIINLNSGLALTVPDGKAKENEQLDEASFNIANKAQHWKISYQAYGLYRIKSELDTTKGLHVAGGSSANGAKIELNTFKNGNTKRWGYFFISPASPQIAINAPTIPQLLPYTYASDGILAYNRYVAVFGR